MFIAFVIAIILTAAEFIVGIFAIFSRWGSFATTIVSTVSLAATLSHHGELTNPRPRLSSL